jgi:hypothetical protein
MNEKAHSKSRILLSTMVILMSAFPKIHAQTNDSEALQQRILRASHLSRINDVEMKPWHLKFKFQLFDTKGKPAEVGTIEEWWGGLSLWKQRIESPSYTATVIENREGDFRTLGVGTIPVEIRAVEQSVVYPMPMGEDLSRTIPHLSHMILAKVPLDCIQLDEPPIHVPSATFCLDLDSVLHATYSLNSSSVVRSRLEGFQGHSFSLLVTEYVGGLKRAEAEVSELAEIRLTDDLFSPSTDMSRATDMHIFKVTTAR